MVKGIAILSVMTMIGTNAFAADCFYRKELKLKSGEVIEAVQQYDCRNSPAPEVIIVEREIEREPKTLGEYIFDTENDQWLSHTLSILIGGGAL